MKKKFQVKIDPKVCKACQICVKMCPKGVIELDEMGKARINDTSKCTGCRICEMHCPDFGITVGEEESENK